MVLSLSQARVLVFVFPVALAGLLCVCWAVFMQVAFKNNADLVSSVTSQEFVLSLSAGVRFASDTWAARRSFGVMRGFKAFCCQMELFHELGRYHPDLELPDRFGLFPSACDAGSRHCSMWEAVLGCLQQHPVNHLRLCSK